MTGNQFTIRNTQSIMSGQQNNVHISEQQADMFREILISLDYQVYDNDDEVCDYVRRHLNYRLFENDDDIVTYVLEDEVMSEWREQYAKEIVDDYTKHRTFFEDDDEITQYVLENEDIKDELLNEWRDEVIEEFTDNHICFEDDEEVTAYVLNDASMTEEVFEGWFKKYKGDRLLFESEFDAMKYLRDTGRYNIYEGDGEPLEDPPCCLTAQALKETETKLADAEAQLTALNNEFERLKEQNERFFQTIQKQQKECEELALVKTLFRGLVSC